MYYVYVYVYVNVLDCNKETLKKSNHIFSK